MLCATLSAKIQTTINSNGKGENMKPLIRIALGFIIIFLSIFLLIWALRTGLLYRVILAILVYTIGICLFIIGFIQTQMKGESK